MPPAPMRVPAATPRYCFSFSSCGRDLAQRAEQLGAELLVRVVAQEELLDVDAGELVLALLEVVEARARDVDLDRHVGVRRLGDALDHAPLDRARRQLDHAPEAAERAAQLARALAGTGGTATGAARREARASRRCSRRSALRVAALLLAAPALERAQLVGGGEAHAARRRCGPCGRRRRPGARPAAARSGRSGRPAPRACARAGCRCGRRCRRAAPRS